MVDTGENEERDVGVLDNDIREADTDAERGELDEEVREIEVKLAWEVGGEMFSELRSCSPKESTVLCVLLTMVSADVNRGGILCWMPLTIMKARAIQKDEVSLRIRALNVPSARDALALHTYKL